MDKKMKRMIGYKPNPVLSKVKKDTHPLASVPEEPIPPTQSAVATQNILEIISEELIKVDKIVKWINGHPEFKWGVMCDKIGIDKGNFHRTLKSNTPKIKIEYIAPIEDFIKNYGYAR